ncbi:hypothetical protein DEU56DRAFT_822155 [Suillus clintonianus]|uniref:uncharacterized protein n=1 Tax=Suillus clintonianus TaxID=1904413 RepID=UPI001B862DF5|nr:uncharacterized protein DEU56DRAFT_822155 [Suillus clintonianus]KAG2126601.1 hypothetical protein DEU56DRAFT_822155 [Suillus clintonianus]
MLGVQTYTAGLDVPEDIPHSPQVPDPERARNVRLALQSLDPFFARPDHENSRSPAHSSGVSVSSSKKILRHKKKYRPPPLTLPVDVEQTAQQYTGSFLDHTEPESRQLKSQRSLPTLRSVSLPVPTHAYRSSISSKFPASSPTSMAASSPVTTGIPAASFLTVPSAHPPISPSTPSPSPPPSPSTTKRKRFSRLCRKFGESPPPELVFGGGPVPVVVEPRKARVQNAACFAPITEESIAFFAPPVVVEPRKAHAQNAACFAPIMEESIAFFAPIMEESKEVTYDLDTSSTSTGGTSEVHHRPSTLLLQDAEIRHHVPTQYDTACMLERKGRRTTHRDYDDVLRRLRSL